MSGGLLRRPAVPAPARIRRDVNNLSPSDPIITFYRQAIGVMKGRPLRDPTSWRYQAAIHDYPRDVSSTASRRNDPRNPDPFATDADFPLPGDRDTFWRKCEHAGWFFLSWHRMYLHHFEKIVMSIVAALPGGPTDWALPYWNYSTSAAAALLPAPFRNETMPDGTPNLLRVAERTPNANAGAAFLDAADTNLNCLRARPFGVPFATPLPPSFGGGTRLNHPPGPGGALEQTPHNQIHSRLGGPTGFMGGFSTAPLDPMFWLHHCNIDRLWEAWVQRQKQQGNLDRNPKPGTPVADGWLDQAFDFHDATGAAVRMTSREVLNTRVPPLSYEYEDTSDPFGGAP